MSAALWRVWAQLPQLRAGTGHSAVTDPCMKQVTKEGLFAFIKSYPRRLSYDMQRVGDPPMGNYYDFSLGKEPGPRSLVAQTVYQWIGPNGEMDGGDNGRFYEYWIRAQS